MEPTDLPEITMGEPDIEIEIEDPEKVTVGIGDMEIVIDPDAESDDDFNANLAEDMSDEELQTISTDLLNDFEEDLSSRKDWMQTYVDGLDLLGLKLEEELSLGPELVVYITHC